MQKSINNISNKYGDKLPSSNPLYNNSINSSRILQSDHYQKHQPQTHANKLLTTKSEQTLNSNFILNNQQQTNSLLKKHVYTNNDLDPLNLFHLPEQGNHLDNSQIAYEQVKNGEQMLNYYSKALMLTIVAGVFMCALNVSIFLILWNRRLKQNERQKQLDNDEQSQKQLQQSAQQTGEHHLKMINNEELIQYDDYLEVSLDVVFESISLF